MPDPHAPTTPTEPAQKCACVSCHCAIPAGGGVTREGKLYCSKTCAYDCTEITCVCVHKGCNEDQ